jgi:hypothetical protein
MESSAGAKQHSFHLRTLTYDERRLMAAALKIEVADVPRGMYECMVCGGWWTFEDRRKKRYETCLGPGRSLDRSE